MAATFTSRPDVSAGSAPVSIAVADVNNDGKLDLLMAVTNGTQVLVRLGDGQGGFSGSTTVGVGTRPLSVAVGDLNGDGKLDLVTANAGTADASVRIGDGLGGFSGSTSVAAGAEASFVAVGNIDGDQDRDILVANTLGSSISVGTNDGTGGFASTDIAMGSDLPTQVSLVDIDGDLDLDLVAADYTTGTIAVRLNDGAGTFSSSITSSGGFRITSFALGDVNGDGKFDFVATNISDNAVTVRLGDGAGHFTGSTGIAVGTAPRAIALADLDGDGKLDLVVTNEQTSNISIRYGDGAGNFAGGGEISVGTGATPTNVVVADVNGDNRADILVGKSGGVAVLLGGQQVTPITVTGIASSGSGTLKIGDQVTFTLTTSAAVTASGTPKLTLSNGKSASFVALDGSGKPIFAYTVTEGDTASGNLTVTGLDTASGSISDAAAQASFDAGSIPSASGAMTGRALDATRPAAPTLTLASDTGTSNSDHVTSAAGLTLGGQENGAAVSYVVDGGSPSASFNAASLSDGQHTVTVTQADAAGNLSSAGTITFTLDRSAAAPVLSLSSDTGLSASDGITSSGALNLTGIETGAVLSYVVDGGDPASQFDWASLADGQHTVALVQTDKAGNVSQGGTITFTLDRAVARPTLSLINDTGASVTDRVTRDGSIAITGSSEEVTASYVVDNGPASGVYDQAALSDGTHTVSVTLTDKAGNVSQAGALTFTIDRSGVAPTLALQADTGSSALDGITSNGALAIAGAEPDAALTYVVDGGAPSTAYDYTLLADGSHTVAVTQTDQAGNVRQAGSLTFTLDRVAAAAPTLALTSDTGASASDGATRNAALTVAGLEAGTTLSYAVDGGAASGSFDPNALADGRHTVSVTQTDKAGNVSDAGEITFTLDRAAPAAGGVDLAADTGRSNSDALTNSAVLTLSGQERDSIVAYTVDGKAVATYDPALLADGSHTVVVTQTDRAGNAAELGRATFTLDRGAPGAPAVSLAAEGSGGATPVTNSGALVITGLETGADLSYVVDGGAASDAYDPASLSQGRHTVSVTQTDGAGNASAAGTVSFVLDSTPPAPGKLTLGRDTGTSASDLITKAGQLLFNGAAPGTNITFKVDGESVAAYKPATLPDGKHSVIAFQSDAAGNRAEVGRLTFTLDRAAAAPAIQLANDTGKSKTDRITSDGKLAVTGKESGAKLAYVVDGKAVDDYIPADLAVGRHTVSVTQTDLAGNVSDAASLTFDIAPDDVSKPYVKDVTVRAPDLQNGTGTLTVGDRAVITLAMSETVIFGKGDQPYLLLSNGSKALFSVTSSGEKTLAFTYKVQEDDVASNLAIKAVKLNDSGIVDRDGKGVDFKFAIGDLPGTLKIDGYTGTKADNSFKGTAGAETFTGLAGNDQYEVNNKGDKVVEAENGGTDSVRASVTYQLEANVENLTLTGKGLIDGTGNSLDNVVTGNDNDNVLKGEVGNDRVDGGNGNDTLYGGNGNDVVIGGQGNDTIKGANGSDRLEGGLGNDTIQGNAGADTFVFATNDSVTDPKRGTIRYFDVLKDFVSGEDRLELSTSVYKGLLAGTMAQDAFKAIASATDSKGVDDSDRILYVQATGDVYFDRDGSGTQYGRIKFADLADGAKLAAGDFLIV